MYNLVVRHALAPILDFIRGTRAMEALRKYEESQWWSPDKIMELQSQRLRQLLRYAYDTVPYYRTVFDERALKPDDIADSNGLVKLPIVTKRIIQNNSERMMAHGFPAKERVRRSSGGTLGQPLVFYTTVHDHVEFSFASRQRIHSEIGFEPGDKNVVLRIRWPYQSIGDGVLRTLINFFQRTMEFDVRRQLPARTMRSLVSKIAGFQPEFIVGYPSAIEQLARFVEAEGKWKIRPEAVITDSEQLYGYQRDLFRQVFGCDTYDFYTSQEQHLIASECTKHSGYHIAAENVVVEIVDDKGFPLPSGKEGRILITNLHNYAMPFIRYEIGDVGMSSDKMCPCGRGLPMLASLKGRMHDVLITRSGRVIPGIYLAERVFANFGVSQYQTVQETYEKVVVKVVLPPEYPERRIKELKSSILSEFGHVLGDEIEISVELVDDIPLSPAGKRSVVKSNLPRSPIEF